MSPKKKAKKKLGTNEESIARAEQKLGIRYPGLIREMLKERNEFFWGAYRFFGVLDDEDKYHTFDDVVRENNNPVAGWAKYLPKGFVCIANQDNNCLLLNKNNNISPSR